MKLPKTYKPNLYESDIYALWEKSESFAPKHRGSKSNYCIVMPPPNANGNLHIGYELTAALEDIPSRYHRMKGKAVLLLPGADHAGFESQVVYEKHLAKEGKSRFDFTREDLYQQIWDFVAQNRTNFQSQMRRMGVSCDWQHFTYTLDQKIVTRAYETFKRMWDEGLIYRGERLVNFCTFHGTGFADIEVEYQEVNGKLWHIKYPLTDGSGEVIVATTRPETMLGDTAVAVHPDDDRYKSIIGKTIKLPLTQREIPIIQDTFVDQKFGTGAVKLTPAHDPNDFEAASRHDLPMITVIDHEGKITHQAPPAYRGLSVQEAREAVVSDLSDMDLISHVDEHKHNVGHCYKCHTVIEPLLKEQWFVNMKPLATKAIKALRADKIKFYPQSKKDQLITYLKGLHDWNISRQIAWGIPIPAFQNLDNPEDWIFDTRIEQEIIEVKGMKYRRDQDVFDTWFSSSSWPYAVLDYPDGADFKQFYPTDLMDTGGEILYPWVSRMIMLGLYVTGDVPFRDVYIHGYVMAEDGSKMSKSVGNVVDPMPVIDQYGSDALRLGIIASRAPAINRGYDPRKVEDARNFCNKLWNVARFIEDKAGDKLNKFESADPKSSADHWLLNKLNYLGDSVADSLENYKFSEAYELIYHFVWDDLADWYIEASKAEANVSVLAYALNTILKITHPFAPFLTETIWQTIYDQQDNLLITTSWPSSIKISKKEAKEFEEVQSIVNEIRYVKAELGVSELNLYHQNETFLNTYKDLIRTLAKINGVISVKDGNGLNLISTKRVCWLDLDKQAIKRFMAQLENRRKTQDQLIAQLNARLKNKAYLENAPKEIVLQTKEQLKQAITLSSKLTNEEKRFRQQLS